MKCVSSLYDVYYKVAEVVVRRVGHHLEDQEETVVFTTDRPQKGRKTEVRWKFHVWFGLFTSTYVPCRVHAWKFYPRSSIAWNL